MSDQPASSVSRNRVSTWFGLYSGYLMAAAGAFLFGSKGIYIKLAYGMDADATTLMALRLTLSTPFFLIVGLMTWWQMKRAGTSDSLPRFSARPGLYLKAMAIGILGYWLASFTDFMGLKTLTPQYERLIIFTYPLFVILLGAAFFGQKLRASALWAFAIAYCGLGLVFVTDLGRSGSGVIVGSVWCLASSVAFALYLLLAKPYIARLTPSLFTSWAMIGAAIAALIHYFIVHGFAERQFSGPLIQMAFGLAIGATVLPSYLINFALQRISSQANAIISFINPVFTLLLSWLILKETITPADVGGTGLVIIGVALYTWLEQRSADKPAA
jgi:drug/metabolite transporter (DMT)-like permease